VGVGHQVDAPRVEAQRVSGWYFPRWGYDNGVRCIAAPVRDHTAAVVAGRSVSAPASRVSRGGLAEFVPLVLRSTAELSGRLGYQSSATRHSPIHVHPTENRTPEEVPG
jgi:DNA-binding IclR family transcriptional regulator